ERLGVVTQINQNSERERRNKRHYIQAGKDFRPEHVTKSVPRDDQKTAPLGRQCAFVSFVCSFKYRHIVSCQKPDRQGGQLSKSRSWMVTRPSLTVGLLTPLRFPLPSGRCPRANHACRSTCESVPAIRQPAGKGPGSQCRPAKLSSDGGRS